MTQQAEALIAQVYLAGTNTRRMRRALAGLFGGAVSKDTVSRAWRKVQGDLLARGLAAPELLIVDGGKGLEAALASLGSDIAVQRCSVHKERNLLAHAPKHLHDEIKADDNDMMYAKDAGAGEARNARPSRPSGGSDAGAWRTAWKRPASGCSPCLSYPPTQWRSLRTTNAIERLHEEFKRRIKTQCALRRRRNRGHAVLGADGLGPDHHAPGRWLADLRSRTSRGLP